MFWAVAAQDLRFQTLCWQPPYWVAMLFCCCIFKSTCHLRLFRWGFVKSSSSSAFTRWQTDILCWCLGSCILCKKLNFMSAPCLWAFFPYLHYLYDDFVATSLGQRLISLQLHHTVGYSNQLTEANSELVWKYNFISLMCHHFLLYCYCAMLALRFLH